LQREKREKRIDGPFFSSSLFVGWKEMGGFGLIMVYKTEKMGDGCMSCPCDSRQIAIALDLVSLDPFILFYFFLASEWGKKRERIAQETYTHILYPFALPYSIHSKFFSLSLEEQQRAAKPFFV
jgi:hypothetical protein